MSNGKWSSIYWTIMNETQCQVCFFPYHSNWHQVFSMSTKIKGIYKGFKYISQIFVASTKEQYHEIEIGYPTDVKHVAHIGWDGPSGNAPSWMSEFQTSPHFAATSIGNINNTRGSTWSSSQGFDSVNREATPQMFKKTPIENLPKAPEKHRRKKNKTTSSPKSSHSSRSSRAVKSKTNFVEENARQANIEVM